MIDRLFGFCRSWYERYRPEMLDRECIRHLHPNSLLFYYGNIHSQRGQDGILAEILRRLNIQQGLFVEFGAWDGLYLSNCRFLYEKGWTGVFIESDPARFNRLQGLYQSAECIQCIRGNVGTTPDTNLSQILHENHVDPNNVTLVSIDVDGPDLDILTAMNCRPPVILIEGGFNFSPYLTEPIPAALAAQNLQQPISVICATAKTLSYTPVCFYQDTYLVRSDIAGSFASRDAVTLYKEAFYFMPIHYRAALLKTRRQSTTIQEYERRVFGEFHADPLAYTS
jgi:hypothetical protein